MKAWQRLVSKTRESGALYTLQLLSDRLVPKFIFDLRAVFLCELALSDARETTDSDPGIHLADADEFDRLLHQHPVLSRMRGKLGSGVQLWVLMEGDEIEAFMWLDPHVIRPSDWLRIELTAADIAGIFLWVSPERRGIGLGPRINRHVSQEYARVGYERIVSTVDSLNRNSLRADEKVGYARIGKIRAIRLCGFGWVRCGHLARIGWWTRRHPLTLPIEELEHSLRRAR